MIHSVNGYKLNIGKMFHNQNGPCDDHYIGVQCYNNGYFNYNNSELFDLERKSCKSNQCQERIKIDYTLQCIPMADSDLKFVVLLESPHIDEFNSTYGTAPAWGNTGNRLNTQFIKCLNRNIQCIKSKIALANDIKISVYIVNAIQYQCSLGLPLRHNNKFRDTIFEQLWNTSPNNFLDDLVERLDIINPDLIINACTINLQKTCCNGNAIVSRLNNKVTPFISANCHMSAWDKNTILL